MPAAGGKGAVCRPLDSVPSYLQSSSLLASDRHLTEDERKYFCQEILSFASQTDSPGETLKLLL